MFQSFNISDIPQHKINSLVEIKRVIIEHNVWLNVGVNCATSFILGAWCILSDKYFVNKVFSEFSFLARTYAIINKGDVWLK